MLVLAAKMMYILVYTEANMNEIRTKPFRSGNSQAVRLPKEVAYPDDAELVVVKCGEVTTIYPKPKMTMQELVAKLRELPKPPEVEIRDTEEIPEPEGL
jgi:antitoxin VapB